MKSPTPATRLRDLAKLPECPSVVALIGPDRIRRDRGIAFILNTFAQKDTVSNDTAPRTFSFNNQGKNPLGAFLSDISAASLFDPQRFAVIRQIELARAADLEPLVRLLNTPPAGLYLIITGEGLPNAGIFKKALAAKSVLLEFEVLKGAELRRWTERELRQAGIEDVSDEIVEAVISLGSESADAIAQIVEKYALFLDGEPAGLNSLQAMFPGRTTASDFELAESLLLGKRGSTEVLVHRLVAQGSSPFMLMGLVAKTLSIILRIRALSDKGLQSHDIRADLGISPWLFNKYLPLAKRFTTAQIARHLDAVLRTDFRLKDRSLGPEAVLSGLVHEMGRNT